MTDYKEKIKKLLALAESPNEHEARAALLKARQLMAEHKIEERELKDVTCQEVKKCGVGITCSKRRNPWIMPLSAVIAENYCCRAFSIRKPMKKTYEVGFIGFEDDFEICSAVFKYAVDCILAQIKAIKADNACYYTEYVTRLCNSYGYGFKQGIDYAFQKQQEEKEQEWGLVLVTPKEVEDEAEQMEKGNFIARAQNELYQDQYVAGFRDGTKFDSKRRIGKETAI